MIGDISYLILDMDGVLWHGETPVSGLVEFFADLRRLGIGSVLATNNASKTPAQYVEKLARFGVTMGQERILTSAEATAEYLSQEYGPGTKVYVVGENGLQQAMTDRGFVILTAERAAAGDTAPLVVAGFDRYATYNELAMASLLVHKGARFIGTNPDPSFPSELGPLPGAGALQAVISCATGIQPFVIGKPGPVIFREALRRLGSSEATTAMVGDRLSTDIAGGKAAGLKTILVLSGISSQADVDQGDVKPDYVFADISVLARKLKAARSNRVLRADGNR